MDGQSGLVPVVKDRDAGARPHPPGRGERSAFHLQLDRRAGEASSGVEPPELRREDEARRGRTVARRQIRSLAPLEPARDSAAQAATDPALDGNDPPTLSLERV